MKLKNFSFKNFELPFHVVKRSEIPLWKSMLFRVIAVVAALLLCSILGIFMIDANPIKFVATMFDGAFGTTARVWALAKDASILLCIALAITPAFKKYSKRVTHSRKRPEDENSYGPECVRKDAGSRPSSAIQRPVINKDFKEFFPDSPVSPSTESPVGILPVTVVRR